METVLLGLATPTAVSQVGSFVDQTFDVVAKPFATILQVVADAVSTDDSTQTPTAPAILNNDLSAIQRRLADEIAKVLSEAGITLSDSIELRISEIDGRLEVAGEHLNRALIESALADHPHLAREFAQLVGAFEQPGDEITAAFSMEPQGTLELRCEPQTLTSRYSVI